MSEFINHTNSLLSAAKGFRTRAIAEPTGELQQAMLRSSLLHSCSFLEAHLNYLADHFRAVELFDLHERAVLLELEVSFDGGEFSLTSKQRFSRMTDRIELLLKKCAKDVTQAKGTWFGNLKNAITARNSMVHPRDLHILTEADATNGLRACMEGADALYRAVFNKGLPIAKKGIDGGLEV